MEVSGGGGRGWSTGAAFVPTALLLCSPVPPPRCPCTGGIYRHVWLTAITTPGPYLGPHGIYAPSAVTGPISWTGGAPFADATLTPSVEVWNNASSASPFSVALTVVSASGAVVATASGSGSAAGGGAVTMWAPAAPLAMPGAALWHLVSQPLRPALYTLVTALTVGGVVVDTLNVTFGVRTAEFRADTGFWLNGVNTKILGAANHQVSAGGSVARFALRSSVCLTLRRSND